MAPAVPSISRHCWCAFHPRHPRPPALPPRRTFRNITISGARKAGIFIYWNWVFSFVGLTISDCPIGITWPKGAASLILLDSEFKNLGVSALLTTANRQMIRPV